LEAFVMSPHGDLIAFGFFAIAVAVPAVAYYLYTMWCIRREAERHNKRMEAYYGAIHLAIKKLGGCAYGKGR
jgi:hypothetical protein